MTQQIERIVIVDDNEGMQCTLSDILEQAGYLVNIFGRGNESIEWMKTNTFAVVILDLRLADIDGMDLLAQIRLLNPEAAVIMMTGYATAETAVEAMRRGAYSYIIKPFDARELVTLIKKALKEIRLSRNNKELIDQLQLYNRDLERYKKSLEERTSELEIAMEHAKLMAKEARSANESKSMFLSNMSHEIRTPMNAIIGFTDLLAEETPTETQQEYIRMIHDAGENLLFLINDILDFSKIEAGKLEISRSECSLDDLCQYIESIMSSMARQKELDFAIIRAEPLPSHFIADSIRIRQCLLNLVGNAIKFTEKGHVHLKIYIQEVEGHSFICFAVEDTGIGISESKCNQIFNPFMQADQSTTRKFGGTGLGLTISRQLADLMGGSITVKSQVDVGSVFTFIVPILDNLNINETQDIIQTHTT